MTRRELRELALIRLKEARVLLRNGNHDGAYYLGGYCIECALKACIAKRTRRYEFPDKKTVEDSHTHRREKLLGVAQLSEEFLMAARADLKFVANWNVVKDWSEQSRYKRHSREEAENIFDAIADKTHELLEWTKQHW